MLFWALALLGPSIAIVMTAGQLGAAFGAKMVLGLIGLVITLGALVQLSRGIFVASREWGATLARPIRPAEPISQDPDKTTDPNRPRPDKARCAETNRAIYMVAVAAVGSVVLM